MIFIDNKYTRWYYDIVQRALLRSHPSEKTERHHIIPECLFIHRSRKGPPGYLEGNPESSENKVSLTFKEHRLCHLLLIKMTSGTPRHKMVYAAKRMFDRGIKVHGMSRGAYYALLRTEVKSTSSKMNKGRPSHNKGIPHSPEIKLQLSLLNKGKRWYNNGVEEMTIRGDPPEGWQLGRLKSSIPANPYPKGSVGIGSGKLRYTNGDTELVLAPTDIIPAGYYPGRKDTFAKRRNATYYSNRNR